MLSSNFPLVLSGVLLLSLNACDVPSDAPGTSSRVASRHCERPTGSLVCSNGINDAEIGTVKDPSLTQTSFGARGD